MWSRCTRVFRGDRESILDLEMSAHYLIRLIDEQGDVLAEMQDTNGFVDDALVPHGEAHRGLSRHIDPYGRTSFNGAQCETLLEEVESMSGTEQSHGALLVWLRTILQRAVNEVHLHVVFLGD
jgi:hypothetical protein